MTIILFFCMNFFFKQSVHLNWEKLFVQKNKLVAVNFDIPSETDLICQYRKPTTIKFYQGPPEDTERQLITADDEENASRN